MKKALYFYLAFTAFSIFTSISCSSPETHYFDWNSINLRKQELFYQDGFVNYRSTDNTNFLPLSFGIEINFEYQIVASLYNFKVNSPYSLYAFRQSDDIYILNDKISYIKIKTIYDFDQDHLAGNDITEYFNTLDGGIFKPVDSRINGTNGLNTDRIYESQLAESYILFLRMSPTIQASQQFEVEVKFESGKTLTQLTDVVNVQ